MGGGGAGGGEILQIEKMGCPICFVKTIYFSRTFRVASIDGILIVFLAVVSLVIFPPVGASLFGLLSELYRDERRQM